MIWNNDWIFKKSFFLQKLHFFSYNVLNVTSLKCDSMNNQECKIRTKIMNINNNEPLIYSYSTEVNKCSHSCDNISDPYSELIVSDVVKISKSKYSKCQSIQSDVKN